MKCIEIDRRGLGNTKRLELITMQTINFVFLFKYMEFQPV